MIDPDGARNKKQLPEIWLKYAHSVKWGKVPKDRIQVGSTAQNIPQWLTCKVVAQVILKAPTKKAAVNNCSRNLLEVAHELVRVFKNTSWDQET